MQLHSAQIFAQIHVTSLLCENTANPLGIDNPNPSFSWQLFGEKRNTMQTAYELRVGTDMKSLADRKNLIWNTGKISSDRSVHIRYEGAKLLSGKKYFWQVKVWDNHGNASEWSAPEFWQMGLLDSSDWKAKWISPGYIEDTTMRPCPIFRKEFAANKKINSATAFITAHGLYEAMINGARVGEAYFTPGFTNYDKRLQYQTYDVTSLMKEGKNAIGVTIGEGWYRGVFGPWNNSNNFGKDGSLLLQLEIVYSDGTSETIISDESWKSFTGAIRYSDLYNGEIYDAREERIDWTKPGYDEKKWFGVTVNNFSKSILNASLSPLVKKHETFKPVKIFMTPKGEHVIDFGQNLTGWVQCKISGKAGDSVRLSHAEILDKEGNFFTGNLREAKAQDVYILRGGEETFEPHFTFHGFRYVKVEGYAGVLKPEDFTAITLYSSLEQTGSFITSNKMINQLQSNIQWSQKDNFLDIPTDCPQRSERLGWAGDVQMFARTASYNMRVDNFLGKWLKDLIADQGKNGGMPNVIPDIHLRTLKRAARGTAGWGDAAVIVPWTMYVVYGDTSILERQYASMKAWVDYIQSVSKDYLWKAGGYGDWLAPDPYLSPDQAANPVKATLTDVPYISQCFFAYSTQLLINTAKVLGKTEDVAKYTSLLEKVKDAFLKEYMTPNGRAISNTQTAYVLPLYFDMLPESLQKKAVERLVELIKANSNHLSTGFIGTPYLCHVLTKYGYTDLAFEILNQDTPPSWLYPVKMGATTIWEKWDAVKPDGELDSVSFNHYAYGAIGDWLYRVVAGIDNAEPGYKKIIIKPHIGGGLTHVATSYKTNYGMIVSEWTTEGNSVTMNVEIPANTTATIYIPASNANAISENGKPLTDANEVHVGSRLDGYVTVDVGSGKYKFQVNK